MDDDVLEGLGSDQEHVRLAAAREVMTYDPVPAEIDQAVRRAFATETVPWVRGALAEAIAAADGAVWDEGVVVPAPHWDSGLDGLDPDAAREAIHTSTRRVLH